MSENKFADKIVNLLYDKTKLAVLAIFILGLVLRVIAAINLDSSADDITTAMVGQGISSSGKLTIWSQSNALYYYLLDYSYKLFGATQFGSRLPALIFGSLSIILIFLLTKEFFKSRKIAMLSAFLLAICPWHIKNTLAEMDVTVLFFVMLSALFIVKAQSSNQRRNMIIAGFAIGIGILIKLYALFFAFSLVIYYLYANEKEIKANWKIPMKNLLLFILIGFLLFLPSIISNYLFYMDKGMVDFIPTNVLGIGKEKAAQYYSWAAGWNEKPDYSGFFYKTHHFNANIPSGFITLRYLFYADLIVFILGFLGLIFSFKQNRRYLIFFLLSFIPVWFYISSVTPLSKHLLFEAVLFIPLAAFSLNKIHEKMPKIKLRYILLAILIFQLLWLARFDKVSPVHFYSKSSIGQFIEYKNANIPQESLVIFDSRIYRERANWMMQNRYYIEASLLNELMRQLESSQSQPVQINTFFVECVTDDCGWGTVKNQPEFNQSMEYFVEIYSNISKPFTITQKSSNFALPFSSQEQEIFKVYNAPLMLKPEIISASEFTHSVHLYPLKYNEKYGEIFDKYKTESLSSITLNKLGHLIFYTALLLVFISIIFIFLLFFNEG